MTSVAVRALVVLALCVATSVAVSSFWGGREGYDNLIHRENLFNVSTPGEVITRELKYPKVGINQSKNITCITVTDRLTASTESGGRCWVRKGGINQMFVTMECISQRDYGMNFLIEIYGK